MPTQELASTGATMAPTRTGTPLACARTLVLLAATGSGVAMADDIYSSVSIQRVADPTVPVPGGGGFFNAGFLYPAVEGNQLVFEGGTNGPPFKRGFYRYHISTGVITTIADTTMLVPGTTERFRSFGSGGDVPGVAVDDGKVAFHATVTDFLSPLGINYAILTDVGGPLEVLAYLTDANRGQPAGFPRTDVPGPWPATNQPNPPGPGVPPINYRPPPFYFNGVLTDPSLDAGRVGFVGWWLGRVPTGNTGVSENGLFLSVPGAGPGATIEKVTDSWGPEATSVDPEGFLLFRSVFGGHADGGSVSWTERTNYNPPGSDTLTIAERVKARLGPVGTAITAIAYAENVTDSIGRQFALGDSTPGRTGYLLWDLGGENGTPPPVTDDSGRAIVFTAASLPATFRDFNPRASAIEGVYRWDANTSQTTRVIDSLFGTVRDDGLRYEYFIRPAAQSDVVVTVAAYNDAAPGIDYDLLAIKGSRIQRLLGSGDAIGGRIVRTITTHRDAFDANRIAFRAQFADGTAGVFLMTLTPACCPADFNCDGQSDFFDFLDFVEAFGGNDQDSDFNRDGQLDFFDYLEFAEAFAQGCA
ncbi:MAG: hypothetical protein SFZ23_02505 [Planctomycetota bacterium]|nr:hypothetical protein [Planctomycetota bacterium]